MLVQLGYIDKASSSLVLNREEQSTWAVFGELSAVTLDKVQALSKLFCFVLFVILSSLEVPTRERPFAIEGEGENGTYRCLWL